jgi:hypothetical protein
MTLLVWLHVPFMLLLVAVAVGLVVATIVTRDV